MGDKVKKGNAVIFVDAERKEHDALVTETWDYGGTTDGKPPSINLLYVSDDEKRTDEYGRQIIRLIAQISINNWHGIGVLNSVGVAG